MGQVSLMREPDFYYGLKRIIFPAWGKIFLGMEGRNGNETASYEADAGISGE
jgi:hypothetical protein